MYGSEMPSRELLPPPIPPFRMFGGHGYLPPPLPPPPPPLPTPYRYSSAQIKGMYSNPCTPRNVSYGLNRIQRRREMKSSNTSNSMPATNNSMNGPLLKSSNGYTTNNQSAAAATTTTTTNAVSVSTDSVATAVTTDTTTTIATITTSMTSSSDQNSNDDMKIPSEWMKRNTCELCKIKLNGNLQADAHYEGKNHAKKARQYLEQLWQSKGNKTPLPASIIKEMKEKKSPPLTEMYCKLCDVAFTSDIQANQHHNGRNHQRRLRGEPPLPKGFYNPITKTWQRQPPVGVPYSLPKESKEPKKITPKFYCTICSATVTSQAQLENHVAGAKHKLQESFLLERGEKIDES